MGLSGDFPAMQIDSDVAVSRITEIAAVDGVDCLLLHHDLLAARYAAAAAARHTCDWRICLVGKLRSPYTSLIVISESLLAEVDVLDGAGSLLPHHGFLAPRYAPAPFTCDWMSYNDGKMHLVLLGNASACSVAFTGCHTVSISNV